MTAMRQWYVVMSGGDSQFGRRVPEFAAVERIGDEGYEAFCPTVQILVRARSGDRLRERRVVPLWDGYVFARLDDRALGQRLAAWRDKGEIWDVIRSGGQPTAICDEFMLWLRAVDAVYEGRTTTRREVFRRLLTVGDTVEHRGAAFEGLRGTVVAIDRDAVEMVLTMLGAERRIRAARTDVEVVT